MRESLQQINKWINESKDQRINRPLDQRVNNESKCAENRNEEKKTSTYFKKSSCLEDALRMPS